MTGFSSIVGALVLMYLAGVFVKNPDGKPDIRTANRQRFIDEVMEYNKDESRSFIVHHISHGGEEKAKKAVGDIFDLITDPNMPGDMRFVLDSDFAACDLSEGLNRLKCGIFPFARSLQKSRALINIFSNNDGFEDMLRRIADAIVVLKSNGGNEVIRLNLPIRTDVLEGIKIGKVPTKEQETVFKQVRTSLGLVNTFIGGQLESAPRDARAAGDEEAAALVFTWF